LHLKQIDFETNKIVGYRKYKQFDTIIPKTFTEFTGGVNVRMYVEPTQTIIRKYPLNPSNLPINFADYDYY